MIVVMKSEYMLLFDRLPKSDWLLANYRVELI